MTKSLTQLVECTFPFIFIELLETPFNRINEVKEQQFTANN